VEITILISLELTGARNAANGSEEVEEDFLLPTFGLKYMHLVKHTTFILLGELMILGAQGLQPTQTFVLDICSPTRYAA
jgi:hypothetical protein